MLETCLSMCVMDLDYLLCVCQYSPSASMPVSCGMILPQLTNMTKLIVAFRDFANVLTNINKKYLGQHLNVICCERKTHDFFPAVELTTQPQA